ncbi:phage tail domain-containing protein [Streptomyces sp. H39-C1]|uniref:phage tail domain-containing protein n=1 Tax=Streptomyces sp. H39-C1 TaxID=3004355 RepID=UPI0022AEFB64|nr:phage tail domain-containing protein [Streptomyces sp. H39-C1]MCZ4097308.1 phage tail family protein [Streptomyces sp. H39-C1]
MPIPAKPVHVPDSGIPPGGDYVPIRWPRTFMTWTGANLDIIPLTGDLSCTAGSAGIGIPSGPAGLGMPTFDLKADQLPNMDGGLFKSVRATTRDITIPVVIRGVDRISAIKLHNRLLGALNPNIGPGWITVSEGDGIARHIECYYLSGGEGSETRDNAGFTWIKYALVFRAMDPYWYSNAERQYDWTLTQESSTPFLSSSAYPSFFPMRISAASFQPDGTVEVVNDSSVESWPVWSCVGPATGLILENRTTGKSFKMRDAFTVPSEDTMTVDTNPGVKTATLKSSGTNLWPEMKADSALWSLHPGKNVLKVTAVDVSINTLIRLHFVPRYLSYIGG